MKFDQNTIEELIHIGSLDPNPNYRFRASQELDRRLKTNPPLLLLQSLSRNDLLGLFSTQVSIAIKREAAIEWRNRNQ